VLSALPASSLGDVLTARSPASTVAGLLPSLPTGDLTQVMTTLPKRGDRLRPFRAPGHRPDPGC